MIWEKCRYVFSRSKDVFFGIVFDEVTSNKVNIHTLEK